MHNRSNFVHILPVSTHGPIFCLIMRLVGQSMLVLTEYLFTFSFGCTVFFFMSVYNIFHQSIDGHGYFQSCSIKNSATTNNFVYTSLSTQIGQISGSRSEIPTFVYLFQRMYFIHFLKVISAYGAKFKRNKIVNNENNPPSDLLPPHTQFHYLEV